MGPIGCPETSVRNYHYSLCNDPEERSSNLLRGGSLKSRKDWCVLFSISLFRFWTLYNKHVIPVGWVEWWWWCYYAVLTYLSTGAYMVQYIVTHAAIRPVLGFTHRRFTCWRKNYCANNCVVLVFNLPEFNIRQYRAGQNNIRSPPSSLNSLPSPLPFTLLLFIILTMYVVGWSKSFRPDQLFKVTEIKQLCYFST